MNIQLQPIDTNLPVTIANVSISGNEIICNEDAVLNNVKVVVIQN